MSANTIELPSATDATGSRGARGGRIAGAVVLAAIGAILALVGGGAIGLQLIGGDEDGYLTKTADLQTRTYALATDEIDLDSIKNIPDGLLGTVRIRMTPAGGEPLFVGIAKAADVERYLAGVRHAQVSDITDDDARYEKVPGGAPELPVRQSIWAAESHGPGEQEITWKPRDGHWKVVAMNADARPGVDVSSEAGARLGWLVWVGLGCLVAGLVLIATAILVARPSSLRSE